MAIGVHRRRAVAERNKLLREECLVFMQQQRLRVRVQLDAMEQRIKYLRFGHFRSRAQLVRDCDVELRGNV